MSGPTLEELLACLGEQEAAAGEGYRTAAEWGESLHVAEGRLHKLMRLASQQGKLLVSHDVRPSIDGRQVKVPVYRFNLN